MSSGICIKIVFTPIFSQREGDGLIIKRKWMGKTYNKHIKFELWYLVRNGNVEVRLNTQVLFVYFSLESLDISDIIYTFSSSD